MKLHEKFRSARELRHWSQEFVAEKLGISVNGYAKIERGETKTFHPYLKKIVELLELNLIDLWNENEPNIVCSFNNKNNKNNKNSLNENSSNENSSNENSLNNGDTAMALKMSQLTIEHLNDKLTQKETEIENLHEIIGLLKRK